MITKDISIYESGDGGELLILNNDLALQESLYSQVYLALFGGNVEQDTKRNFLPTEQRNDYWANALLWSEETSKQFNSQTERTLETLVLNSAGRLSLIRVIESDLSYLSELLTYSVDVEFPKLNNIRIIVKFTPKTAQEDKVLQMVYDNAKNELIIEKII